MKATYKNYILPALVLAITVAAIYGYRQYNRKPANLTDAVPQQTLTADELVAMYDTNEESADKNLLGKVIQVSGVVAEITAQDTLLNVLIGDAADMHKVSCMLDVRQKQTLQQYRAGSIISIKGICTGYLLDVELNRCVIVAHQ